MKKKFTVLIPFMGVIPVEIEAEDEITAIQSINLDQVEVTDDTEYELDEDTSTWEIQDDEGTEEDEGDDSAADDHGISELELSDVNIESNMKNWD
jgi:hypothetical protein